MAVGFTGANFQAEPSILDPFRARFDVLGPTPYLRLKHLSCRSSRHLSCLSSLNITMFKSQKIGPERNHQTWPEMGPEWSPGPENRPPGMPRPFPSLWDQSRGQKSIKV